MVYASHIARTRLFPFFILLAATLVFPNFSQAACDFDRTDFLAYPPFLTSRIPPNVLLVLDNSGSMDEYAYHEISGLRDGTTQAWTGYQPGKEYYGLFNPNKCYKYDNTNHFFYVSGDTVDDLSTPNIFERSAGDETHDRRFSGNWLNWWTMRRIDIAKKVLTGGRIAPDTTNVVLEGMPTEREYRRIFNDYTTATDPHNILTGAHAKNVYYTPFRQGIYSYWYNVDRADHLGGGSDQFVPMFNVVAADFNSVTDLEGTTDIKTSFSNPVTGVTYSYKLLNEDAADCGDNLGDTGYSYTGYIVALKVEPEGLPVQGIIQKMADRVRFGYMQFNYGRGPGEGVTRNNQAGTWDIDSDGTVDITWRFADGGRVRNYIGDYSTTTDPHGTTVLQIVQNINQQNIQMNTPLEEVLWEAGRYFQQITPAYQPEDDPDEPPNNAVDFEISNTWDPYYFNDLNGGEFVPCSKSYIIFVSDGEGNNNSGVPTANWPSGANATFTGDLGGYLDDIAHNLHTEELRDDVTTMNQTADLIKQTITLYTVFTFDDSNAARCELMRAARAGGFEDLNGDGETGGTVSASDPSAFVGDPEWDKDGNNIPDTYFEAQDGAEMESELMAAIADILSRSASGTAASVISNARGGEGAIYQAVFYTESEAEPLTAKTVKWTGNVHALFIDDYGLMHEDSNNNQMLDSADLVVVFDGQTGRAKRYNFNSTTQTLTFVNEVEISDVKFIWDAHSWMSAPSMNVTSQRPYGSTAKQRYIFTDFIDTSSTVSLSNVDSTRQMDFLPSFADDAANDNYYFLNPYVAGMTEAEMITEAQQIIRFTRGEENVSTVYRDRSLDLDGNGMDDTVFRIGDIIHSTPTVVSQPSEDYDLLYKDDSYRIFRKQYIERRIVVYTGANDGMLHAFNGGFYYQKDHVFETQPAEWDSVNQVKVYDTSITPYDLGAELWAYVPNALLPHLKWLKEPLSRNTHFYYVDQKPRIFDARIFAEDADHPGGWGTVLIGGMRLGGAPIGVDTDPTDSDDNCDLNFRSAFFALDITNPEAPPELLWSFSDSNLGFTTSYPTPMRVGNKWFIVIGSGPTHYDAVKTDALGNFSSYGGSNQTARVYILNAEDGSIAREFITDADAFMADPIAVDFDLQAWDDLTSGHKAWNGEAIYIASDGAGADNGKIFRIQTYRNENPITWTSSVFFDPNSAGGDQHINTAVSVAQDDESKFWVYFGTGRFWGMYDRSTPYFSYQNSFYGIKEPGDPVNDTGAWGTIGNKSTSLLNVTGVTVANDTSGTVSGGSVSATDFSDLLLEVSAKDGWYFDFDITGERNLGQATVLGDIVSFTTFLPDNDICATEGISYLYGVHYKTGTAYKEGVLKDASNNYTGVNQSNNVVIKKLEIGKGFSTTPNLHTGRNEGSKAFIQTSTGAIIGIEQINPGVTKSGKVSWRDLD